MPSGLWSSLQKSELSGPFWEVLDSWRATHPCRGPGSLSLNLVTLRPGWAPWETVYNSSITENPQGGPLKDCNTNNKENTEAHGAPSCVGKRAGGRHSLGAPLPGRTSDRCRQLWPVTFTAAASSTEGWGVGLASPQLTSPPSASFHLFPHAPHPSWSPALLGGAKGPHPCGPRHTHLFFLSRMSRRKRRPSTRSTHYRRPRRSARCLRPTCPLSSESAAPPAPAHCLCWQAARRFECRVLSEGTCSVPGNAL